MFMPILIAALLAVEPTAQVSATTQVQPAPVAAPVPVQPAQPEAEADPSLNRVVCRTEPNVGTRLSSRTCLTRREWNDRREASRALAHRLETANANRGRVEAPGH